MTAQLAEDCFITAAGRIRKILVGKGWSRDEAEDLVQEAFVRMQVYRMRGGEVRTPEAFLLCTAKRLALNARRDEHRDVYVPLPVEDLTFLVDAAPQPDEVLAADQCLERMSSALDTVSQRSRQVFLLHRLDGLSYPQIAQRLGVSVSTVERHIASAIVALMDVRVAPGQDWASRAEHLAQADAQLCATATTECQP